MNTSIGGLPKVFDAALELGLARFLATRTEQAHLVMPSACLDYLDSMDLHGKYFKSIDLQSVNPQCNKLFVFDPENEAALASQATVQFSAKRVVSVQEELIPVLACQERPFTSPAELDCDRIKMYAVVCTPRTGSTFLCEALMQSGAGRPIEHLRGALALVIQNKTNDREAVYRRIVRHATRNGVFGTKLISHFLLTAYGSDGIGPFFSDLLSRGFSLIFLRRSLIEQTISNYFATQTKIWHVRRTLDHDAQALFESVPYDFDKLFKEFRQLARDEGILESSLAHIDASRVLRISYQDLTADAYDTVTKCLRFIGLSDDTAPKQFNSETVRVSKSVDHMREMVFRFERDLATKKFF